MERLRAENTSLQESVSSLTEGVTRLREENKVLKEAVLDLQARSLRDNLVFVGILEKTGGQQQNSEQIVKDAFHNQMKIPEETVKHITFH